MTECIVYHKKEIIQKYDLDSITVYNMVAAALIFFFSCFCFYAKFTFFHKFVGIILLQMGICHSLLFPLTFLSVETLWFFLYASE